PANRSRATSVVARNVPRACARGSTAGPTSWVGWHHLAAMSAGKRPAWSQQARQALVHPKSCHYALYGRQVPRTPARGPEPEPVQFSSDLALRKSLLLQAAQRSSQFIGVRLRVCMLTVVHL